MAACRRAAAHCSLVRPAHPTRAVPCLRASSWLGRALASQLIAAIRAARWRQLSPPLAAQLPPLCRCWRERRPAPRARAAAKESEIVLKHEQLRHLMLSDSLQL